MEFSSFSTDACEPAADGGIVPGMVPIPNVNPDELEEAAGRFRTIGEAIEESGEGITTAWASLTGIYVAPEADTLLSALDPVSSEGSTVATGVKDAADALMAFAETARELKSRLNGLKAEAEAFRADVGWDKEWLEDEDKREQNNDLNNRIATAAHQYEEAERDCANKIGQHYDGTWFTGHSDKANYDQTKTDGERAYQLYGTTGARVDQANPWGSPVDAPTSAWEDAFWGLADIATGAVIGLGLSTGLYRDGQGVYPFGTEHGQNLLANWQEGKETFWSLLGSDGQGEWVSPGNMDAQYQNAKAAWFEYGDSIVPVSQWDDRPMYTAVNGVGNVALMFTPAGWARTLLDTPGGGGTPRPNFDGSLPADRGPNGVSSHGSGLHGTDTVGMPTTSPSAGQPAPGSPLSGMHETLSDLQSQLDGNSTPDPGTPTGSSTPTPGPENPTPSPIPTPETSSSPASPSGDAPSLNGETTPSSGEGTTPGGEGDAARDASDLTARDLRDGTMGSGADSSSDPWATSPVNDGSATGQQSPTTPVTGPTDRDGTPNGTSTTDSTGTGTHQTGEHGGHRDDDTPAPAEPGGGHGGGGRDDGSGVPPNSPYPDDGSSGSRGSGDGDGDGDGRREDDSGDFLDPSAPSGADPHAPLQERVLDPSSNDPAVQVLFPKDGKPFGDGVALDPDTHYTLREPDGQRSTEYITDSEGNIREIRTDSSGWNAKHPELLTPRPNMTYVVDGRYTFHTDEHSRTVSAEGKLTQQENNRNDSEQREVGHEGMEYFELLNKQHQDEFYKREGRPPEPGEIPQYENIEYQGGHLVGTQFFGIGENLNMVPMRYDINQNRTATAFHDRDSSELGGIDGSFANVERTWRGIFNHKGKWHGFEDERFNDGTWNEALARNPENPQIDVKVTNVYEPNMKPIKDPNNPEREIFPPPSRIIVEWHLNGAMMRNLAYDNFPPTVN